MAAVSKKIEHMASAAGLTIGGMLWDGDDTVILLITREPEFWFLFTQSEEYQDGKPDPLDRWSVRVIRNIGDELQAKPSFPSDGPPYPPFVSWAIKSGEAWSSPVQILVHRTAGMMLSVRGALRVKGRLPLSQRTASSPCKSCADKPCQTSCPVNALTGETYDVIACQNHLRLPEGADCLKGGCIARRTCPVSLKSGRLPEQSEFHMRAFLK